MRQGHRIWKSFCLARRKAVSEDCCAMEDMILWWEMIGCDVVMQAAARGRCHEGGVKEGCAKGVLIVCIW